jgi:hypothetical protein
MYSMWRGGPLQFPNHQLDCLVSILLLCEFKMCVWGGEGPVFAQLKGCKLSQWNVIPASGRDCCAKSMHTGICKAVNRGDKRTRRVRDRDFAKFERSRRYRDRYRCQGKKSRRGRYRDLVFRDPPRRERELDRCSRIETPTPPLTAIATFTTTTIL